MLPYQDPDSYQKAHETILKSCSENLGEVQVSKKNVNAEIEQMFTSYNEGDEEAFASLDIFKPEKRPFGRESNKAMLYIVGPNRRHENSDSIFLDKVEKMASNAMRVLQAANGTPQPLILFIRPLQSRFPPRHPPNRILRPQNTWYTYQTQTHPVILSRTRENCKIPFGRLL